MADSFNHHGDSSGIHKVEMKTLNLSEEASRMITDTLNFINGEEFQHKRRSAYKDKGVSLGRQYWLDRGSLVVKKCVNNLTSRADLQDKINFGLEKLKKYGFFEVHCKEALEVTSGDVGCAYELLMSKYFNVPIPPPSEITQEIKEERRQELESLKSIYENSVIEHIPNQLWIVNLQLQYLIDYLDEQNAERDGVGHRRQVKSNATKSKKGVCRYYFNGKCRFGNKCRFSHEPEPKPNIERVVHDPDRCKFQLEIRFPLGSKYPRESPIVFLKHFTQNYPIVYLLKLTNGLLRLARESNGEPCVFNLIDYLHSQTDEVIGILKSRPPNFPSASSPIFPPEETQDSPEKNQNSVDEVLSKPMRSLSMQNEVIQRQNRELRTRYFNKVTTREYQEMLEKRKALPAWSMQDTIIQMIAKHQIIIVSGETGCGKSTQVPQFILDAWLHDGSSSNIEIICTQPRRISTITLADRVACERAEKLPESVGYQIRLESKLSSHTRLIYCTNGIILRKFEKDGVLSSATHIVVDEVHERSEESDFLLLVLKELLPLRPDLKIILMSATIDSEIFSKYFGSVPVVTIPGRTFPVQQFFLEDILEMTNYCLEEYSGYSRKIGRQNSKDLEAAEYDQDYFSEGLGTSVIPNQKTQDEYLLAKQVFYRYRDRPMDVRRTIYLMDIDRIQNELIQTVLLWILEGDHQYPREGSILIFLPGLSDIQSLHEYLLTNPLFASQTDTYLILPLHSTLTNEEQAQVFRKVRRRDQRKIILSTNIAETSVTIDDCVFVIDTGKMKQKGFDSDKNMESLDTMWESRANATQRKGRAGRVREGVCFHLFTRHRYDYVFVQQPTPEICRAPLEQLILKVRMISYFANRDLYQLFGQLIEPPPEENVSGAITRLKNIGALIGHLNELTALGRHLGTLPMDVRIGKLVLFGAIFCCVDSALTIAACLSYKSPFIAPYNKKEVADEKKKTFITAYSDHLTILKAYKTWLSACARGRNSGYQFANENFLSFKTLMTLGEIKAQFLELLIDIGFIPRSIKVYRKKNSLDRIEDITGQMLNANGSNYKLLASILCAALYPNIVKVLTPDRLYLQSISGALPTTLKADELKFKTKSDGYVYIHPSSVNFNVSSYPSPFMVFQEKWKSSKVFVKECTMVPVLPLVMFCGGVLKVELIGDDFVIDIDDGWIILKVESSQVAELLESIKSELMLLLKEKIEDPSMDLHTHPKGHRIISSIVYLVSRG